LNFAWHARNFSVDGVETLTPNAKQSQKIDPVGARSIDLLIILCNQLIPVTSNGELIAQLNLFTKQYFVVVWDSSGGEEVVCETCMLCTVLVNDYSVSLIM